MVFRVARHTNNLDKITNFYCSVLNLNVLGKFNDHNGYNGIFLGKVNIDWHLEFTQNKNAANHFFDEDDILVFYPKTISEYELILSNIKIFKIQVFTPKNPYWKDNGILIKDPDGYNIILSKQKIV